jgi:hypothetical protein
MTASSSPLCTVVPRDRNAGGSVAASSDANCCTEPDGASTEGFASEAACGVAKLARRKFKGDS